MYSNIDQKTYLGFSSSLFLDKRFVKIRTPFDFNLILTKKKNHSVVVITFALHAKGLRTTSKIGILNRRLPLYLRCINVIPEIALSSLKKLNNNAEQNNNFAFSLIPMDLVVKLNDFMDYSYLIFFECDPSDNCMNHLIILTSITSQKNLNIELIDINAVYFNAKYNENIYIGPLKDIMIIINVNDIQRVSNNYIKYINHNIRRKCKIEILEINIQSNNNEKLIKIKFNKTNYRNAIGNLLYKTICTRSTTELLIKIRNSPTSWYSNFNIMCLHQRRYQNTTA
ncbi:hypothetical protein H8356DRAFT_1321544 [Neocallimastix lanati (nom. inval.)]|nr:hypothetical protein H8356DRAFT_1321544 [Neocallimastix sp. JGI-2020a]